MFIETNPVPRPKTALGLMGQDEARIASASGE